jgi:hypothetical protein
MSGSGYGVTGIRNQFVGHAPIFERRALWYSISIHTALSFAIVSGETAGRRG